MNCRVQALESPNELKQCEQHESRYLAMEDATAQKLWSVGQSYFSNVDESHFDETLDDVIKIVQQYAADVVVFNADGYDGRNCSLMGTADGAPYSWSLVGSMLFAITVYTTVGLCRIYVLINHLTGTGNYSGISNNMKLVGYTGR